MIQVAIFLQQVNRNAASQGQIAFVVAQALHSQMDGHQRCGAGSLHSEARPGQVEFVGGAGGQEIFVITNERLIILQHFMWLMALQEIAVETRARIQPDSLATASRIVTRVL